SGSNSVKVQEPAAQVSVPRRTSFAGDESGNIWPKSIVLRFSAKGRKSGLPAINFTASTLVDFVAEANKTKKSASAFSASNLPAEKVCDLESRVFAWATSASICEFSPR